MTIGASTYYGINSRTVLQSVKELKSSGFTTVELMYEYNNYITDTEALKLKQENLDFSMHAPFVNAAYLHPNPDISKPQIEQIEKSLKTAKLIGCSHYVMHGGLIPLPYFGIENPYSREDFVNLFIERFKDIFEQYSDDDMQILIENLPTEKSIGNKIQDIKRIQEEIPSVGICHDIAHSEVAGQTYKILNNFKIDYVHITDNDRITDGHMVVGDGKIDFRNILSKLISKGFEGKIIIENLSYDDCCTSFDRFKEIYNQCLNYSVKPSSI